MKRYFFLLVLLLKMGFMSCHLTKKVPKEKYLLTKNVFIINGKKVHFSNLENYVKQKPNKKILNFFPVKLIMYNFSHPDLEEIFSSFFSIPKEHRNKKVLNHLLKRIPRNKYSTKRIYWNFFLFKNGEKPIIIDNNLTKDSIQNLNSHFYSKGYLDVHTDFSLLRENEKKGKIIYNIYTGNPYFINSIIYNFPEKELKDIYLNNLNSSLIKEGKQYDETHLILEIERMKNMYEDHGYYNFDISDVKFRIDPSIGNQKINLYMEVNKVHPSTNKHRKHFFNEIVIKINQEENHSIFYNGYKFFIPKNKKFNPKMITDILTITPGSLYKKKDILSTQQNIYSLHNFNIDQFKIEEKKDHKKNSFLNVEIFLSTLKDHELKFHIENSISKKMDIGIHPGVTFLRRNLLKSGANLMLSIKGNFISSKKEFLNMSKFSLQGKLIFPSSFIDIEKKNTLYKLPNSIIFQINSQKNMGVRRMLFSNLLNYEWKDNSYRKHKIKIVNLQLVKNLEQEKNSHKEDIIYGKNFFCRKKNKIFPEKEIIHCKNDKEDKNQNFFFDQRNPIRTKKMKKTFEEYMKMKRENILKEDYFINSIIYNYEMNQTLDKRKRNPFVLRENIEISGNLLSPLFRKTSFIKKKWNNIPSYSFFKYDLSFKRFCFLEKYHTLVSKLFFGIIFTHEKLPKSYFLRKSEEFSTWDSFYTKIIQPEKKKSFFENTFLSQNKILLVHEYRYEILSKLISVIFLDLGNVWFLDKKKNSKEIRNLKWNSFYKELTLGGGIGFRYDLKFFIFRIDFAYKFYDPYQKEGKKWIISHLKIQEPLMNFGIHSPLPF
ncbi:POTRA domain-containing protein [Blattabacterium sp. (Periplaneta americana)]|uniref:translocation and assembly module lipoprotein TamL n=1 Tax=Blattabacterium sp. (Periplaneta americana) TaxID=367488 RepID=UPI0011D144C6|nr:POTRA domain-containing protein [Blattabacterium sp. (Periplaneta americana)]